MQNRLAGFASDHLLQPSQSRIASLLSGVTSDVVLCGIVVESASKIDYSVVLKLQNQRYSHDIHMDFWRWLKRPYSAPSTAS